MKNVISFILAVSLSFNSIAATPVSTGKYIGGGIVGTVIGLGIGHAIQGRYKEMGWIFTVGELAAWGVGVGGVSLAANSLKSRGQTLSNINMQDMPTGSLITVLAASLAITVLRVWEAVDVWVSAEPVSTASKISLFHKEMQANQGSIPMLLGANFIDFNF